MVTAAVHTLWLELVFCDAAELTLRKKTELVDGPNSFFELVQSFVLEQNIERSRLLASSQKQRKKRAILEEGATFLYASRFKEKEQILLVGSAQVQKTFQVSLDFYETEFFFC